MVINRKIKRTILENKARYIGSVILILLGCMLFTAFKLAAPSVKESVEKFRKDNAAEDAFFIVQKPLKDMKAIEKKFNLTIEERESIDYAFDKNTTLRILRETKKLDKYEVLKGSPLKYKGDILIFDKFAKAHDLDIGSTMKIAGKNFRITGFITVPDYLYVLKSENDLIFNNKTFGIAVLSYPDFASLKGASTYYSIRFGADNKEEVRKYINGRNILIKWVAREDNPRMESYKGNMAVYEQMGTVIPLFILIVTCILLAVVNWRLLKSEFTQIGTLYALGYRKIEILRHYLSYSLLVSLLGSALGIISGEFLAMPLVKVEGIKYNFPLITIDNKISVLITAFVLPFIFLIPVSCFVVIKALGYSPLTLIKGGAYSNKTGWLERKLNLNSFGFNTKFKIRELVRNIPRSIIMIAGVAAASMFLLLGFTLQNSIDGIMQDGFNDTLKYEYTYFFNSMQYQKPVQGEMTSVGSFNAETGSGKKITFSIQGMQKDSGLIDLVGRNGSRLSFKDVIMTKILASKLGIGENDSVKVENKLSGKSFTIKVNRIADDNMGSTVYMPIDRYNRLNGYPEGSYTGLLSDKKIDIAPQKLIAAMRKNDFIESYKSNIVVFRLFTVILGFIACIIGLIIIYIITSIVIEENRSGISLMKILGYSKKRIYSLILNSNNFLVVIGYIIGIPLIIRMMGNLLESLTKEMDVNIPVRLYWPYALLGFVLIYITYEVSKLLSRRKIINISMADSLKSRAE